MAINRTSPKKGKVVDIPDAVVTIGTPTAGDAQVSVAFTATSPATGGPAQKYTAISSPGSITASGSTSPVVVTGLTNDTAYTFTVAAANATGTGVFSSASASATPAILTSFESIATLNGTGSSTYVTFNSIPSTYKHLQLRITSRNGRATTDDSMLVYFNSVTTGSQYTYHAIYGDGTSVASYAGTSASTGTFLGYMASANAAASIYGVTVIDILDYANTNKYKTAKSLSGIDRNGSGIVSYGSGVWMNTAAISSISLGSNNSGANWTTDSQFALYGIKG